MSFHRSLALLLVGWVSATAQPAVPQPPADQPAPAEAPPAVPVNPAAPQPQPIVPAPNPGANPANPAVPANPVPAAPGGLRPVIPGRNGNAAAAQPLPVGGVAKPAVPLGETKIVEDIIEPKLSGDSLAGLWRKYTGRRVIVTSAAATAEFHFVQEATPQDPLTYNQAAELLRKAAILENFAFVPHPQDPNLDILTLATGGPRPGNVNVDVYGENTPLPDTDIVISYVMTLDHIKPDQALNIFTQIIGQFGAYGSIAAVPNASAVVITEKASLIKSLLELKKTIDVPGDVQSSKFIKVQYADVTEIATTLTDLLTAQQSTQQTAGVQRNMPAAQPGAAPNPAAAQGGASSGGGETAPPQIIPEPRTNRIFIMGRPVDIVFIEGLVREFDIPSSEKTFLRRKLRFLTVSEFLPIAGDALTRAFSGTGDSGGSGGAAGGAGGGAAGGNRSQTSNRSQSSGTTGRSSTSSGRSSSSGTGSSSGFGGGSSSGFGGSGGGSSGFGGGGGGGAGSALSDPNVSSAPESLLVGRTLLVADNITNSIVAQGPPSALEVLERLLDQLDVKPDQVMISTVIGQLTLNDKLDAGVSYLFRGDDILGGGGAGFPGFVPTTGTGTGGATTTSNSFPVFDRSNLTGGGLRAFGTVGDMRIFVKALQTKTDFTVLSRPSIFTSNNQKGSISSGERIAIPTNSNSFSNGGASTNIEYQDVVLKLEVIPLVNSDHEITMQIALLNDEQNGTQTITGAGSNGADLTVPKISTREILTTVTVPNNDTVVLGGLIVGRNGKDKSGIPFLSDIPYLGALFGTNTNTHDRSELMVLMQPSIVRNANTLADVQTDMDSRYKVTPSIQNFADNGVLPSKVDNKGKGGSSTVETTSTSTENATMKPSIRPSHKR